MFDMTRLNREEVAELLNARGLLQQELFRQAREVRSRHAGDEVTLRGVIEVSNFCQKKCSYCAMRCCNKALDRFRLERDRILEIVRQMKALEIGVAFLQSGQDPIADDVIEEVIPILRNELHMEVLLCVGERPKETYERFARLGATSYILKYETSDPRLYEIIAGTPPDHRLRCMHWIREAGMKLGTGNIVGLPGQTLDTLIDDLHLAMRIRPDFVSCAPFIPNQGTPFEGHPIGDVDVTLNTMALWRIALRTPLIPTVSALEKIQADGQLRGLNAGANVITINFTPPSCREKYRIYSEQRFVVTRDHALRTIERAGLRVRPPRRRAAMAF